VSIFSYFSLRERKCLLLLIVGWLAAATLYAYGRWEYRLPSKNDKDFLSPDPSNDKDVPSYDPSISPNSLWNQLASDEKNSKAQPSISERPTFHFDKDKWNAATEALASKQDALDEHALQIGILCSVPWLWYFLLRRLAEVSAAIRGHD
jgi:hypothetical protein